MDDFPICAYLFNVGEFIFDAELSLSVVVLRKYAIIALLLGRSLIRYQKMGDPGSILGARMKWK